MKLLILRPEPGASATAERARALGLEPVSVPLFRIEPVRHLQANPFDYDALLLTSANAARHGAEGLTHLPCFTVGEATAAAARVAGFQDVRAGPSDGAAAVAMMVEAGVKRALHLCGRSHVPLDHPGITIERCIVYSAEEQPVDPERLRGPAVVLVHSPRAGGRLAKLVPTRAFLQIAAISAAAAEAAGDGWARKAVARAPREEALLELAVQLCNYTPEAAKDGSDGV